MGQRPSTLRASCLVGVAASVAVGALSVSARQSPQQPVFRAGATFVSVDAYPRRDGKVVDGLTKADFEILEDGKPQAVESFEFVRIAPNTPDADRRDPPTPEDGLRQAADPHNRVFVVYLDLIHTTVVGSHEARAPIVNFLTRAIGATDLFAVMTQDVPIGQLTFGRRTESIENELAKYWTWGESEQAIGVKTEFEGRLALCAPTAEEQDALIRADREDRAAVHLEALVARLGSLRDERKNILFISEGWTTRRGIQPGAANSRYPNNPTVGVGPGGKLGIGGNMSGYPDASWCDTQVARLQGIDSDQRFKDLLASARRANVSFYPVDVGGLRSGAMPASVGGGSPEAYRRAVMSRVELLQTLAENTDGEAIVNRNDLSQAARKVADDLSAYYLLGYYSTNTTPDGKFRRIDVKMKKPGIDVSARRGYTAPNLAMRKAEEAAAAKPVVGPSPVDTELARLGRIRAEAKVYTAAASSPVGVDVVVEIASREVEAGRWQDGGAVTVTVAPAQGSAAPVTADARIEPGARVVSVRVAVPNAAASAWHVSARVKAGDEVLDDSLELPAQSASLVGEPLLFRATPSPRSPLRAVADSQFRRTERIHAEWPLARALDDRSARLLSRRGDPLPIPVTITERPDGDRVMLAADLALAPLSEGDYLIEVSASQGAEKVQRLLAFRVVR